MQCAWEYVLNYRISNPKLLILCDLIYSNVRCDITKCRRTPHSLHCNEIVQCTCARSKHTDHTTTTTALQMTFVKDKPLINCAHCDGGVIWPSIIQSDLDFNSTNSLLFLFAYDILHSRAVPAVFWIKILFCSAKQRWYNAMLETGLIRRIRIVRSW